MAVKKAIVLTAGQNEQLQSVDVLSTSLQQATIDFGTTNDFNTTLTVSDVNITSTSKMVCSLSAETTTDHSIDEVLVAGIVVIAGNVVNGVGFDIMAYCENGTTGKYKVNYTINY